jgi:TonB family protein
VFFALILFCAVKRETVVPVLLDYDLYYPDEARRQGMEGTVYVRVLVNRSGKAEEVVVAKSSGSYLLDSAAVRTAKTFTFSPAMMGDEALKAWVRVPIEFKFIDVDYDQWLAEVEVMQRRIEKRYDDGAIEDLYDLYRQMIFSSGESPDFEINEYIRAVVVERTALVWQGYWAVYPARVVLYVDIIVRYPDSFTALKARADLGKYLELEEIAMRHILGSDRADTLVNRITEAIEY